jgi:hypothetical protein
MLWRRAIVFCVWVWVRCVGSGQSPVGCFLLLAPGEALFRGVEGHFQAEGLGPGAAVGVGTSNINEEEVSALQR